MEQQLYTVVKAGIAYQVSAKFDGMRKPQDWVIYPVKDAESCTIQSSTRIARINLLTGEGVISAPHSNGSYFHDLQAVRGAKGYEFPRALCAAILEAPVSGDSARLGQNKPAYFHSEGTL